MSTQINIPAGRLAQDQFSFQDDAVLARSRQLLRDKLVKGEEVSVNQNGQIDNSNQPFPKTGITIPPGKLANNSDYNIPIGRFAQTPSASQDDSALAKTRQALRDKLLRGEEVKVTQEGPIIDANQDPDKPAITIPPGKLAISSTIHIPFGRFAQNQSTFHDDDALAKTRQALRDKLLRGEEVRVTQEGQVSNTSQQQSEKPSIVIPPGKLAYPSFYWYERDPKLYQDEIAVMNHFFPAFKLQKLEDGRLCWIGKISPTNIRKNAHWTLMAVYDNNHPHNNSWGGSIRVYSIDPDLKEMTRDLGRNIPHTLRDSQEHLYLCTARKEDVHVGKVSTSAASALAWAAKWIAVFELWLANEVTTEQFENHTF